MKILILSLFCILLGACANQAITGMLRFQDRELLIHPDEPGLAFPHKATKCVPNTGFWKFIYKTKCYKEQAMDFYDLNDKSVRKSLIDGGFSCKSKMRFKY